MADIADMNGVLSNIRQTLPYIYQMVTAVSYVLGLYLFISGLAKMKVFAEMKMMSGSQASLKGPLLFLISGVALVYFPSMMNVSMTTFFAYTDPLAYQKTGETGDDIIQTMIMVTRVVGAIAFIRGWVLVTHLGGQQSQPGQFAKAMTHIIGGVFAMNIYGVWKLLRVTVGL